MMSFKNKLNQLKINILKNKLTSIQIKDFNDKFNELYMAYDALRNFESLDFGIKKILLNQIY